MFGSKKRVSRAFQPSLAGSRLEPKISLSDASVMTAQQYNRLFPDDADLPGSDANIGDTITFDTDDGGWDKEGMDGGDYWGPTPIAPETTTPDKTMTLQPN